tara:strand:+ start:3228 stop:3887 length:660 start_codon:yes stop_codon:yes gene_type:complete
VGKLDKRQEAAILKLRYAKADCEYAQMVTETMAPEFDNAFLDWCKKNDILTAKQRQEHRAKIKPISEKEAEEAFIPDEEEAPDSSRKKNPAVMKIFKKIAAKIHPDKLVKSEEHYREQMEEVYSKATKAMQENDWYSLYIICMDLQIRLPRITKQQIIIIEKKAEEYMQKSKSFKNSYAWVYDEIESAEEKEELFKSFAERTGCISKVDFEKEMYESSN